MTTLALNNEQELLLTIEDVARLVRVPVATIYQWRSKQIGPRAMRLGKHLRWQRAEVDAWLDEQLDDWEVTYGAAL
jgi:excisionase family DNA binding protein